MSQDLHKIYAQGPLQDLGQGLQPRSSKKDLYEPSMNFPQDRHIRILREVSKISWPGSLRIRESDPRAKARGIWRAQTDGEVARWIRRWAPRRKDSDLSAQSDERVAWKISKRAPCHRESDLTRTEWGKGLRVSDVKMSQNEEALWLYRPFSTFKKPLGVDTLFGGNGASSNPVVNDDTPK